MRTRKKEIVYFGILLFSVFLIYSTFHVAFTDVILSQIQEKKNIFLLSFNSYAYLTLGLLLVGFTGYLYINLATYMVGKLFSVYLTFITTGICLVAATNYQYLAINVLVEILAFLGNVFLYYSIGYLTLIVKKKYFKWMTGIYILLTLIIIIFYFICMNSSDVVLLKLKDAIVTGDYIITIIMIILNILCGYKRATFYSKRQIKSLSIGLAVGIIIFIIMQSIPTLAVVKVPENNTAILPNHQMERIEWYEGDYPIIQLENLREDQNIYPIIVFTGIVIAMIYILIKREYLALDESKDLKRYTLSIIYLILANTYFLITLSDNLIQFVLFNIILVIPLLIYNNRICKRGDSVYDNNMVEVLEEERQRLSIFLHDEILQDLIAVLYFVKAKEADERLSTVIGEIRNMSQDLYPTIVEDLGVEQSLKIFMDDIRSDYNVDLEYQYKYPKGALPTRTSLVIYRTVKELVTNAIKHSDCTKITVAISEVSVGIECMVSDNGKGFHMPENEKLLKSPHLGLYTIRKQITNLSGNLRIKSDKTGSKFQILIPLR